MNKVIYIFLSFFILINISNCGGYKPIFDSSNIKFKIADHSVAGDNKLSNQIYSKLYNVSNKDNPSAQSVRITIRVNKDKIATVKDTTGKILEYKINLNTIVDVKDYLTNDIILKNNFTESASYKVQDQHSETVKLENKNLQNMVNKISQDILIKISEALN